jgi:hypothetical protein
MTETQRLRKNEKMKIYMREKRKNNRYAIIKAQYNFYKKELEKYEREAV